MSKYVVMKDSKVTIVASFIRKLLYKRFIQLGGIIDSEAGHYGVSEDYNKEVIETIYQEIISWRTDNSSFYYDVLKTLVTDSFAFIEIEATVMVELMPILEAIDPKQYEDEDNYEEHLPSLEYSRILFEIIKQSYSIEAVDKKLEEYNVLVAIKELLMPLLGVIDRKSVV